MAITSGGRKIRGLEDLFTEGLFRKPEGTNYDRPLNKPHKEKSKGQTRTKVHTAHHINLKNVQRDNNRFNSASIPDEYKRKREEIGVDILSNKRSMSQPS